MNTQFSEKNILESKEIVFQNGVKSIQAAAYNGACTVHILRIKQSNNWSPSLIFFKYIFLDFTKKIDGKLSKKNNHNISNLLYTEQSQQISVTTC